MIPLRLLSLLLLISLASLTSSLEPLSTTFAIGTALTSGLIYKGWDTIKCPFSECCNSKWINYNVSKFDGMKTKINKNPNNLLVKPR